MIGSAWIEKVWYYDNIFGSKSIEDEKVLYFEIKRYNDYILETICQKLRTEINSSSLIDFQRPIGGFKIVGKKIWCDFSLNNQDLPKEILVDVFKIENQNDKE